MKAVLAAGLLAFSLVAARGDDAPVAPDGTRLPGHSAHGEAFNEGPRQKAELMEGTGEVHFPITTSSELAQRFFDQGVGQLHGFWYFEAERSFRHVAALDTDCAMAYWGMSMANANNTKRASDFIHEAVARQGKASHREQLWISSQADFVAEGKKADRPRRLAQVRALEKLSYEFPDDIEAKAFLLLRIWDNEESGIPIGSHQAVATLGREILAANPRHPVHHYLIHLWNGEDDRRALASAALCGQVAPAIAHMWHMPGHTFSKLHRYADAAWQQEAAARVDHAHMQTTRILPEQIHNYAHNNNWLVEDLVYIGRVHDAIDLAKNMIELPRPAPQRVASGKTNNYEGGRTGYAMGRERLLETAARCELWPMLAGLEETMYLAPWEDQLREVKRLAVLGAGRFASGAQEKGEARLAQLEAAWTALKTERMTAADEAEAKARTDKKSRDEISAAMAAALSNFAPRVEATQAARAELRLARALALHDTEEAKKQLPLAQELTEAQRARAWLAVGDLPAAEKAARAAVTRGEGEVLPLATLADVLWQAGKKKEALTTMRRLLPLSAQVDLDVPAFARLAPLARELNLPEDWRVPLVWNTDAGVRPALASLGPFRWHPYPAPAWNLADAAGEPLSLADFHGKPVLVVFYLGSGCARCIEQLNVFSPVTKDYSAAGISVVAVSADGPEALHETFAQAKGGQSFNFPILADPKLTAFQAYRAYDDFEKIPLHGLFLIDGAGLVRWQDISFEAFRDPEWLLGEAKRLLALPAEPAPAIAQTAAAE